jgi:hypothetical protein
MEARVPTLSSRLALLAALLGIGVPSSAHAQEKMTAAACIAANESAGPLRKAGKLRDARARLRSCSSADCPGSVRKDCLSGAMQADLDVPTITFSVQDSSGSDLSAVKVALDGQSLAERLDGKALDVDPGEHVFRFEAVGEPVVEKKLGIIEGQKNRIERVQLGEPKPVAPVAILAVPPPAARATNPRRTLGLAVGGTGLVLLAGGAVAGLIATAEWSAAKTACGPAFPVSCINPATAGSDHSATLAASTVADIALGLGGVAVVTGVALVLLPPPEGEKGAASARLTLAPEVGPSSGLLLRGSF